MAPITAKMIAAPRDRPASASSSSASLDQLPPFGIRGLSSPSKPFSLLSVSERQYDASIRSYPETTLTWLDEDDGETITVGSGGELRERLEDPAPPSAPLVQFYNVKTQKHEDRKIHLFDISRSLTSLGVWQEHEAYFSKSQVQPPGPSPRTTEADAGYKSESPSGPQEITDDPVLRHSATSAGETNKAVSQVECDESTNPIGEHQVARSLSGLPPSPNIREANPDMVDNLGKQLGNLADFLQSTSDILKRAAEKTREADTTVIEDVLTGMTTILGEVGAMGLDLIDKFLDESQQHPASSARATEPAIVLPVSENSASSDVSIGFPTPPTQSSLCSSHEIVQQPTEAVQYPADIAASSLRRHSFSLSSRAASGSQISLLADSILDQDADTMDADFSTRFPPLTSLRRVNTVGTTHAQRLQRSHQPHMTTTLSELRGCPSPQVFDAETQRRKLFALSCFPRQEYTPGPGPSERGLSTPLKPIVPVTLQGVAAHQGPGIIRPGPPPYCASQVSIADSEHNAHNTNATSEKALAAVTQGSYPASHATRALPGAWPETAPAPAGDTTPLVVERKSPQELASTLGDCMIKDTKPAPDTLSPAEKSRINHRTSFVRESSSKDKHGGTLLRAHTVTALGHPAARLNGPFDPNYPSSSARSPWENVSQSRSTDDPISQSPTGPHWNVHRTQSDRRPRSFYEPYRSINLQREFEPDWEDHRQHKTHEPSSGVVFVDASNFEPRTTKQNIEDLLIDDCTDMSGASALVSCRIIFTAPVVLAKLIFKNKQVADKIIAKYNKKIVNGRQLRFEYSKNGVDGRINRTRGALTSSDTEQSGHLRHMQSVPTLASDKRLNVQDYVSMAKPSFTDFVKRTPSLGSVRGKAFSASDFASGRTKVAAAEAAAPKPLMNETGSPRADGTMFASDWPFVYPPSVVAAKDKSTQAQTAASVAASISRPAQDVQVEPVTQQNRPSVVELCESALRAMGYGAYDANISSRLKVYAAAAQGVVEDAIDIIEQDLKATRGTYLADDEMPGRWNDSDDENGEGADQNGKTTGKAGRQRQRPLPPSQTRVKFEDDYEKEEDKIGHKHESTNGRLQFKYTAGHEETHDDDDDDDEEKREQAEIERALRLSRWDQ